MCNLILIYLIEITLIIALIFGLEVCLIIARSIVCAARFCMFCMGKICACTLFGQKEILLHTALKS